MAHTITEVDAFTTPITVADGADSRNNAAEVVEAFVQALANRTKRHELHCAFKNTTNTFDDVNTFSALIEALAGIEVTNSDASVAALVTRDNADDDANASNKYKAVLGFELGASLGYVNIYAGTAAGEAQYAITLNAVWDTTAQNWHADNTGQSSLALLFKQSTGLQVSRRPSGSGTWTTWPTAAGDLAVSGDCKVTTGDFKYTSPRTRTTLIPIIPAGGGFFSTFGTDISIDAADIVLVPLKMPNGAVVHTVEVMIDPGGTSAVTVKAHKRSGHTWGGSPAAPTMTTIATSTTSGGALQVILVDFGGLTFDSSDQELWISIQGGNTGDVIWGARAVNWTDPGPINA